jgi:hypothetical protein
MEKYTEGSDPFDNPFDNTVLEFTHFLSAEMRRTRMDKG